MNPSLQRESIDGTGVELLIYRTVHCYAFLKLFVLSAIVAIGDKFNMHSRTGLLDLTSPSNDLAWDT